MRHLLIVTAVLEAGAGLALASFPSATVSLLLGAPLETPAALTVGRIAGAALFALAVASWLARCDGDSRAARGVVGALVPYNLGAAVILGAAGIRPPPVGVALWPVVVVHAAMAGWCLKSLLSRPGPRDVPYQA